MHTHCIYSFHWIFLSLVVTVTISDNLFKYLLKGDMISLGLEPRMSSCMESLLDLKIILMHKQIPFLLVSYLLPLDLLDLGIGSESFLLAGVWVGGGGGGRLHQTNLSPAVKRVEQSLEMETSVTQLEWSDMGELILAPLTASQTCNLTFNYKTIRNLRISAMTPHQCYKIKGEMIF